jgi:AI-2 transport protein TqsA
MELTKEGDQPASISRLAGLPRDLNALLAVAAALFIMVASWYQLKELAPLLRPLVLAVFLAYRILPAHQALRKRVDARFAGPLLALLMAMVLIGLALLIYSNLVDLNAELPQLVERGQRLIERLQAWGRGHLPTWAVHAVPDTTRAEAEATERIGAVTSYLVSAASSFLGEAVLVSLYMVFLLFEVGRLPDRVRSGFSADHADRLLGMAASINHAVSSYIRAKALASFITALPVVVILWAFGVSFPGMWGVLAFIGNFIPYVGSLVALLLPVTLAFLELEPVSRPLTVLALLVASQFVINNFVEPRLTARAVDLSPLVVLIALTFWGLCWGVVGMVLAIPLTVVLKIVWEPIPLTRPLARLMAEE